MNSPVFERVGGSSTNPSPNGSFPTNHFGVCLGARARDAMALATMSVAARVFVFARRGGWRGAEWCCLGDAIESVTCFQQISLDTIEDVSMREPRTSPEPR